MKKSEAHGESSFNFFLDKLQLLLDKSTRQKNPALWLYQNNARTPLFMLEALARLYTGINKEKKFAKLDVEFKLLEDVLGAIDYYDVFAKQFAADKKIPAAVTNYLQAQAREKVQQLNEMLIEKKWVHETGNRITKLKKKLSKADWKKSKAEIKAVYDFYVDAINHILVFVHQENFHFENIETDVHELRRKLRWLSIYPQALQGCVQLSKTKSYPKSLNKYLTKEIINSPFNKMPDAGDAKHFLIIDQNYFYALSWIIAELGRLKDAGLRVIVIKEAVQQTSALKEDAALKRAYQLAGAKQLTIPQLLKQADAICKTYFKEKNLEKLLIGISHVK